MAKKKVIHYAKKGLTKHWWGPGWHTACGTQIPLDGQYGDVSADLPNTTKNKEKTTCLRCKGGMEFACKKCYRNPCECK